MLRKGLAVAVIILFLGLAIQPSVAVQPNTSNVDDDCNLCPKKVSKQHLVLIESLLNRFERYDTQLSVLSKHYPEFEEKYQNLPSINTIFNKKIKSDAQDNEIICYILLTFLSYKIATTNIFLSFNYILIVLPFHILYKILKPLLYLYAELTIWQLYKFYELWEKYDCYWGPFLSPP